MLLFARLALVSTLLLATVHGASATDKTFSHQGVAADAKRYETYLKANWIPGGKAPAALKSEAEKVFATDPRAASRSLANAVASNDKDWAAWTRLAEALLAIKPDPDKGSERYDLPVYASGAAYRGYQRASAPADKAHALYVLGETLERRSYWRPAIDAMKLSLDLADNQATRESYDKLRGEYGFRMTDYKTDNEATPPRLCLEFSEDLSRTQTDVAKFISVDGKDPQNLVQEGKQLCVEGLKHGARYEVQIRAGLPSDIGETLLKTSDIAVYVPDRSPFVRFTGKAYVLPSRGQQGIPVVTTNTSKIDVEVYRIGDRSLAATLQSGDMQRQLSSYDVDNIRDRSGVKVFTGQMDIASKINEEVTTAVPVTDATGKLEPGVYVVVAKPSEKTKDDNERATQWFIVSDLGLTAFTGSDGIHALVRSLSEATAIGDTTVKLIAKNNEVLATAKTDERGYAKFDSAIAKGEGGSAPAILVAEKGEGEYAFLDLTLNAFDLSDRGVKGRDPAGPVDAYVYTERGVYRGGEEVNITALVRDQFGKASSVPTTLIVSRPDGVEQTRLVMNDQGLGGRALTRTARQDRDDRHMAPLALHRSQSPGDCRARLPRRGLRARTPRHEALGQHSGADGGRKPDDQRRRPLSLRAACGWSRPRRRSRRQGLEQGRSRLRRLYVRPGGRVREPGAPVTRSQPRDGQGRQGRDPDRAAVDAEDGETARSQHHGQAPRVGRPHDRAQSDAAGRFESRTHRHQAAVRQLHRARGPERRFRCRPPRCGRQTGSQ